MSSCRLNSEDASGQYQNTIFNDGRYNLIPDKSFFYWEFSRKNGGLMGSLNLKRGELWVKEGRPFYGSFIADMRSISMTNLLKEEAGVFLRQLNSDDFLASSLYPKARFDVTLIKPYKGFEDYNYEILGDLSLRNNTVSVLLLAKITQNDDRITGYAKGEIDPALFGLRFDALSLLPEFGEDGERIGDKILIEMDVMAEKTLK